LIGPVFFGVALGASGSAPQAAAFGRPECRDRSSDRFFFPEGLLGAKSAQFDEDESRRRWYSEGLRAMSDPSLPCDQPQGASYRFLLLRLFDTPMYVRVEARKSGGILRAAVGLSARWSEPSLLTDAEWTQLTRNLNAIGFWNPVARDELRERRRAVNSRRTRWRALPCRRSLVAGGWSVSKVGLGLLELAGLDTTFGMHHY
jgi:hypothetical protein